MTKSELEKALFHAERWPIDRSVLAAARRFADLLPKECETCGGGRLCLSGTPKDVHSDQHSHAPCGGTCSTCHGAGKVWNPEVVERVTGIIRAWTKLNDYGRRQFALELLAVITEESQ